MKIFTQKKIGGKKLERSLKKFLFPSRGKKNPNFARGKSSFLYDIQFEKPIKWLLTVFVSNNESAVFLEQVLIEYRIDFD